MKKNKYSKNERGQALILITFAIIGLIGFVGLVVDGGLAYSDHRHAQNAADSAAYAAALKHASDSTHNLAFEKLAAKDIALANGYDNNLVSNTVTVTSSTSPAGSCPNAAGSNVDYKVEIVSKINTTFATVVGIRQMTSRVFASARACDVGGGNVAYKNSAVYTTNTGTCNGASSSNLYMNGGGNLQVWGGDLASASTDPNCLNFQGGETQLKLQESGTACADIMTSATSGGTFNNVQGTDGCGKKLYSQTINTNFPNLNITCSGTAAPYGPGNTQMTAGNYTGTFPPNSVTKLDPGTYCINGDFKLTGGTLVGNGVTIVMNTGTVNLNAQSEAILSAPTSGDYKGLLIYAPPTNSINIQATKNNAVRLEGQENAFFQGTILVQNLPCWFAGSSAIQKATIQFVCYTWGMDGSAEAQIMYDPSLFYNPIIDPAVILIQ
ncbi:MAG: pilus assembly protein TadG-related protein [Chloroflexi bacterium]|nr:pilus assembly protein TadG-related protein [Chloroflexota bacterium]